MKFEFDLKKSKTNKAKHGIDFEEAQGIWADPDRMIVPAKSDDEVRYALLARCRDKTWAAFYTLRGEVVRIISVRRARKAEEELYES